MGWIRRFRARLQSPATVAWLWAIGFVGTYIIIGLAIAGIVQGRYAALCVAILAIAWAFDRLSHINDDRGQ